VLATREEYREDHKVGGGKEPLLGLLARRFSGSNNGSQMLTSCHSVEVLAADPREGRYFLLSKDLLARFDGDHIRFTIRLALGPSELLTLN
jgi:hypothetical protein